MIDSTRRAFLATAGAGAATMGLVAIAPGIRPTTAHDPVTTANDPVTATPPDASGALVAHVIDVHGEVVTVMVGENEVVIRDRALVARLASAAF